MATEKRLFDASEPTKIKTHFAKIIVGGTADKPCLNILYFDPTDGEYHIGFGSFCLEYVFKWLSEEFEIINEPPSVDVVEVVRCKNCQNRDEITGECKHPKAVGWDVIAPEDNDFCSYGERRPDDH